MCWTIAARVSHVTACGDGAPRRFAGQQIGSIRFDRQLSASKPLKPHLLDAFNVIFDVSESMQDKIA